MKKKMLCILLTLTVLFSLITAMGITASAAMQDDVAYIDAIGAEQTKNGCTVVTTMMTGTWTEGWYVVNSDVTLNDANVTVSGEVHLILMDGCTLIITATDMNAGISISEESMLTIYGQTEGTGTLIATGGNFGAGIGGGKQSSGRDIIINGGTVIATGGNYGAGIGGGSQGGGSNITINGGTVTATGGGNGGAGIGGGITGSGSYITINGGIVTATGIGGGAGIGGGSQGGCRNITINGGMVTATGGVEGSESGAGIGGGIDGSASDIYIGSALTVMAGAAENTKTTVENTGADMASDLAGKRYVTTREPITVTSNADDDSKGTLRWALERDGDRIVFASGLNGKTITLKEQLKISKDVTIDASALSKGLTISGNNDVRIFEIGQGSQTTDAAPKVKMIGLTLTGGRCPRWCRQCGFRESILDLNDDRLQAGRKCDKRDLRRYRLNTDNEPVSGVRR